ncbi:MAG: nuclear transport factor 2 family protein [Gemmatimonadota bacterium]
MLVAACGGGRPTPIDGSLPRSPAAAEIEATLSASAEAWNRKELDGFMEPYLRSPDLTFSGSGGVRRGFQSVMQRYRTSYFEADVPLPGLRFTDLETFDLGRDHALMLGRYILLDPESDEQIDTGYFSLVWVRTRAGWRILHDHTSAAES